MVHACSIGDFTLVGMGAIVLDGAEVGKECLVGAGAVVTPRTKIPGASFAGAWEPRQGGPLAHTRGS